MGIIKFVFGGLLILGGLFLILSAILTLAFVAVFTGNIWGNVIISIIGLILILIGIYLMRR